MTAYDSFYDKPFVVVVDAVVVVVVVVVIVVVADVVSYSQVAVYEFLLLLKFVIWSSHTFFLQLILSHPSVSLIKIDLMSTFIKCLSIPCIFECIFLLSLLF